MPPVYRMDRTLFQARLARAYAESGDLDRASHTGLAACADTQAIGSFRAFNELARVHQALRDRKNISSADDFIATFDDLASDFSTTIGQV